MGDSGQLHADTVHAGRMVASTSGLRSKSVAKGDLGFIWQALVWAGLQRLKSTQVRPSQGSTLHLLTLAKKGS